MKRCPVCKEIVTPDSFATDKDGIHYEMLLCPECSHVFSVTETPINNTAEGGQRVP